MTRLLLVSSRELTRDVRARLQVRAAVGAGLDVVGLTATRAGEQPLPLYGIPITRVGVDRLSRRLRRRGFSGLRGWAAPLRELRGLWRFLRMTRATVLLLRAGLRLGRFDVVQVDGLDALPAGYLLARRSQARLVYDAQELYRYMESDPPRAWTPVASALEGWIARRSDEVITCADPFAREIETYLELDRPAVAWLTCPDPLPELPEREPPPGHLRAIYQAAMDYPAKPVSDLLEAAEGAPDVDLTIRVVDIDRRRVQGEIEARGLGGRVRLGEPVTPDRLIDGLLGFDVGVIVSRDTTPNTALSVPNKLWEYMMAGLATVAPGLPGLTLVDELGVGTTFAPGAPEELGRRLQELAGDRPRLAAMQRRARELALERFNADAQASTLEHAWGVRGVSPAAERATREPS
jgi:glycosyltransferase involved in cell wall biosynthesis